MKAPETAAAVEDFRKARRERLFVAKGIGVFIVDVEFARSVAKWRLGTKSGVELCCELPVAM